MTYFEDIGALPKAKHSIYYSYTAGFVLSLISTLLAYDMVTRELLPASILVGCVSSLALLQCAVQLFCFLHLGQEKQAKLRVVLFLFAILVVSILVVGSVWIMQSLNARMMPSSMHMERYMIEQNGF
jgi:cytochrome o ubiquinol oxidase operon protein cyoD